MANKRKPHLSWQDKLKASVAPVMKLAPVNIAGMTAGQVMLVPTPRLIDDFIRGIPSGQATDVKLMRQTLAQMHGAEVTCPIYTGFHLRTVAEAACEQHQMGAQLIAITPFWRVLDTKSPTAKKLACGIAFIRERRLAEGLEA